jgi:CDP-diacylglycerol pyrophosphatase
MRRWMRALGLCVALAGSWTAGAEIPALAAAADGDAPSPRDALRRIVQTECLPHWRETRQPTPCLAVHDEPGDEGRGYALLADRKGGAHFLLIPTRTLRGIDSPELLDHGAANYFAAAWEARGALATAAARAIPDVAVGLAVNSSNARSQDQLHIHIECVQRMLRQALLAGAERLDDDWRPVEIPGWQLVGLRVLGATLDGADPFQLLATRLAGAASLMGDYSLLVAGFRFAQGPGFVILAGTGPGTERLLDPRCEAATGVGSESN